MLFYWAWLYWTKIRKLFRKEPDSKYFRLCGPCPLSSLLSSTVVMWKELKTIYVNEHSCVPVKLCKNRRGVTWPRGSSLPTPDRKLYLLNAWKFKACIYVCATSYQFKQSNKFILICMRCRLLSCVHTFCNFKLLICLIFSKLLMTDGKYGEIHHCLF